VAALAADTPPEIAELRIERLRHMPSWRRLDLLGQLNQTAKLFALSGSRRRHPQATQQELRRRLADLVLGQALAAQVYRPIERVEHHLE
jgi:hypothetical protein